MNESYFEKTYANILLKRFKIKNIKSLSRKQFEIYDILKITFKNSIDAIKKSNIIDKIFELLRKFETRLLEILLKV